MTRKIAFFEGWSWFKFNNLGLALGTNLKFCTRVAKRLKLKVKKFWGPNPTFVEVTGEKLVRGAFLAPAPILNRVNGKLHFLCSVSCCQQNLFFEMLFIGFNKGTNTAWKMPKYGVISGPYFPAFRLNTERYFVSLRIQSGCGEIRTKNNSSGHFSRSEGLF